MSELLIYSPRTSPRLAWTLGFIFGDVLGISYRITGDESELEAYTGPKLVYAEESGQDAIRIFPAGLLFEKGINDQQVNVFAWEEFPVFFGTHPKYFLPFDLFSAVFYLVSRYEEYLPHFKDEHERFMPKGSLALQKGFLHRPLVDEWCSRLRELLRARYPSLKFPEKKFRYISTIDIDSVFAYREKGLFRTTGAYLRDLFALNFRGISERSRVLMGMLRDPFDTFELMLELRKKHRLDTICFFLVGDYDTFDKNVPIGSAAFRNIIKSVADYSRVGIHPSYASNQNVKKLRREVNALGQVLNREVKISRQHFLKMNFPYTYRNLLELDITEDHTMGYASEPGFRASTCTPFLFYDLDMEQETKLRVFPFAVMDGTLKDALKLDAPAATTRIKELADEVRKVKGTFITLWHNHSFDAIPEWRGWTKVYEDIAAYCTGSGNN